jgi:type I restriction enzyme S subunit
MTEKSNTNTWRKMRIDDCFAIQQGKQVSKKNRQGDNQHPFLRTANVFWGRIDLSELDHMNFSAEEEKKFALKEGDILVCEGGDIGRSAMWHNGLAGCYYQNHLHRLRKLNEGIDENFVLFYLQYAFVYARLYVGRANITTIPNLSKSRLAELEIVLPPIDEQKTIARALTVIQEAIARQTELIAKLKELKQNMMQYLFARGTKEEKTKMTEIGVVPESWDVVEFEKLCVLQRGKDLTKANFKSGDIAVAGSNGIIGFHNVANLLAPAVTVGRSGSCGSVNYYEDNIWAHNTTLFVKDFHNNNPRFVAYYLEFLRLDKYRSGVSVPTLDRNAFRMIQIGLPAHEEQIKIKNVLIAIDKKISTVQEKLTVYQTIFKTLLHDLMSGKKRIK